MLHHHVWFPFFRICKVLQVYRLSGIQGRGGFGSGKFQRGKFRAVENATPPNVDAFRATSCRKIQQSQNSIAFGSAPRREAVSQLDRPAVSQTETHILGFLSVADTGPSSGESCLPQSWQWPNGNAADHSLFGRRFEPWCVQYGIGAATGVHPRGFEPPTEQAASDALPFDRWQM